MKYLRLENNLNRKCKFDKEEGEKEEEGRWKAGFSLAICGTGNTGNLVIEPLRQIDGSIDT